MSLKYTVNFIWLYCGQYRRKEQKLAVQQQNQNHRAIRQQEYNGIMGGSDSFTIIGSSGIGKSECNYQAINLITGNRIVRPKILTVRLYHALLFNARLILL